MDTFCHFAQFGVSLRGHLLCNLLTSIYLPTHTPDFARPAVQVPIPAPPAQLPGALLAALGARQGGGGCAAAGAREAGKLKEKLDQFTGLDHPLVAVAASIPVLQSLQLRGLRPLRLGRRRR